MLATTKKILDKASKQNYAVGAFNIYNLETIQAVLNGAEAKKAPVILQTSTGALEYAGFENLVCFAKCAAERAKVPVALHLDHGTCLDLITKCIRSGYTSVMIDASKLCFEDNIRTTKKVVSLAQKKGVSVEAELGTIGGVEEKVIARKIIYTEPCTAKEFIDRTGIDSLAVAIGTSHGAYKFAGSAKLDIKRLREIKRITGIPLVLHGGSGVPQKIVAQAKHFGAKLGNPEGVPDSQVHLAVRNGINKVNTDTDLRLAFTAGVRKVMAETPQEFDPRKFIGPARELMQRVVEQRIALFGSANKARW